MHCTTSVLIPLGEKIDRTRRILQTVQRIQNKIPQIYPVFTTGTIENREPLFREGHQRQCPLKKAFHGNTRKRAQTEHRQRHAPERDTRSDRRAGDKKQEAAGRDTRYDDRARWLEA